MKEMVRVALDAMGGDSAPEEIVKGALAALEESDDISVLLVGIPSAIEAQLSGKTYPKDRLEIVPASEVIETAESPVAAIRKKKDSSIVVGLHLVKEGRADAFASAGSSGAVLVGGQLIVGRIRGIERPPFASLIPTSKGVSLLLDCGANVDARADHLLQFARMGSIYMREVLGIKNPTVGLVNIGAEEDKGNSLVKETMPLLKNAEDLNFVGSVEARDIPVGGTDVIVAEGFAGNIVLKMYEGTASMLLGAVKEGLMSSLRSKIGALLIKPALKDTMRKYDASAYGGAPMLGLNALVVKMHGSSSAKEVKNTLLQCRQFYQQHIADHIREEIAAPLAAEKEAARKAKKAAENA